MVTVYAPEAVLMAWQRLIQLNVESRKPEVDAWLHSAESEPEVKEFLALVPCSTTVH